MNRRIFGVDLIIILTSGLDCGLHYHSKDFSRFVEVVFYQNERIE